MQPEKLPPINEVIVDPTEVQSLDDRTLVRYWKEFREDKGLLPEQEALFADYQAELDVRGIDPEKIEFLDDYR